MFWYCLQRLSFSFPVLLVLCHFVDHVTKRNGDSGDENAFWSEQLKRFETSGWMENVRRVFDAKTPIDLSQP